MLERHCDASRWARTFAVLAIAFFAAASDTTPAHARKLAFGTEDYLTKLADVKVTGPKGEALYLAHKYSFHSFIAPYRLVDDGYVLAVQGENRYFRLNETLTQNLQARGLLPTPLPPYELSVFDYVFGHLLWLMLAGVAASIVFGVLRRRRRKQAVPLFRNGLAFHEQGKVDLAIAEYTKALNLDSKFVEALFQRGRAYDHSGDSDRAIADYSKVIRGQPKSDLPLIARGLVFAKKGLLDQAISDQTRAIKLTKSPLAHFHRGQAYAAKGDDAQAINDYTSAIASAPNFVEALQNRAAAYTRTGQDQLAQADLANATNRLARAQVAAPGGRQAAAA
jgi:tetratricopeptide (TPR) repeat protein